MYICTYVFNYVCIYIFYICIYACIFVYMYVCPYVLMYVYMCVCNYVNMYLRTYLCMYMREHSKKIPNFFNLLLYLQLNQTCLLESTPLYCWYTAPSCFSSSGTRPGTCFAWWLEGPVANFLPSEIGDLLGCTSTLGTGKTPQEPNLESRGLGHDNSLLLRQKFTDKKRRVGRYIVMVQHTGLVCSTPQAFSFTLLPSNASWRSIKLFIDCLTTWNKLMMNNALPTKKTINIAFTFERHWRPFFGRGEDFPTFCVDCTFVSTS